MSVMTVLGPVQASELGIVTPHEHIFIDMSVFFSEPDSISRKIVAHGPVTIDKLGLLRKDCFAVLDNVQLMDYETQKNEIMYFKYAGGRTVVDASNHGLGRDPELLRKIAVDTGLNVITGSGYYVAAAQDKKTLDLTVEEMEADIVKDLTVGIGHTNIRAGYIGEIGLNWDMPEFEVRSLHAACRAQVKTNAPLMIHVNPWCTRGLDGMKIVEEYGIPGSKVVVCHSDVENNEAYILALLEKGVYVEFDNFGKENNTDPWDICEGNGRFVTDWERVRLVKKLIDMGYGRQLLFSCDICLKMLLHAYGGWGYDHVIEHILPMCREIGITDEQIDDIMIHNPARWLDYDCR